MIAEWATPIQNARLPSRDALVATQSSSNGNEPANRSFFRRGVYEVYEEEVFRTNARHTLAHPAHTHGLRSHHAHGCEHALCAHSLRSHECVCKGACAHTHGCSTMIRRDRVREDPRISPLKRLWGPSDTQFHLAGVSTVARDLRAPHSGLRPLW